MREGLPRRHPLLGEEYIEGGRDLAESVRAAKLFEENGAAWLDISAGIFELPGPTMDPMYYPQGWNTYTADEIKKHVSIPVITSHTLRDPDYCERILAEGKADMVGLSRQLIADPYWANKAKAGKKEEIRRCISCLVGCWQESLMIKHHMRCAINPAIGDERFINFGPAREELHRGGRGRRPGGPRGGAHRHPARAQGHRVREDQRARRRHPELLHRARARTRCAGTRTGSASRWRSSACKIKYESVPTAAELAKFDAVFVATGSKVVRPDIKGIDCDRVITFEDVLRCKNKNCEFWPKGGKAAPAEVGETVLIWGDHFGAADAAEKLGTEGKKVYIVTANRAFASWMEPCHKDVMDKRFKGGQGEGLTSKTFAHPVTIIPESTVMEIRKDGEVVLQNSRFERSTHQGGHRCARRCGAGRQPLEELPGGRPAGDEDRGREKGPQPARRRHRRRERGVRPGQGYTAECE